MSTSAPDAPIAAMNLSTPARKLAARSAVEPWSGNSETQTRPLGRLVIAFPFHFPEFRLVQGMRTPAIPRPKSPASPSPLPGPARLSAPRMASVSRYGRAIGGEHPHIVTISARAGAATIVGADRFPQIAALQAQLFVEFADHAPQALVEVVPLLLTKEGLVPTDMLEVVLKQTITLVDPRLVAISLQAPRLVRLLDEHRGQRLSIARAKCRGVDREGAPRCAGIVTAGVIDRALD